MSRTIVLAAMSDGTHIQVGAPAGDHDAAYRLYEILDSTQSGYYHDATGRTLCDPSRKRRHSIHGVPVRFYRMRQANPEDITPVMTVPVGHVRRDRYRPFRAI